MKKLTKLTALALALALMLGMTAFAEAGILVQYDDFSDANGNIATFKANSTALSAELNASTTTVPALTGGARYYYANGNNLEISTIGGKTCLAEINSTGSTGYNQIAFPLETAWEYNETNEKYALVSQIGYVFKVTNPSATQTYWPSTTRAFAGTILTDNGTEKVADAMTAVHLANTSLRIDGYSVGAGIDSLANVGDTTTLTMVVRPYEIFFEDAYDYDGDPTLEGRTPSLNVIAMSGGKMSTNNYYGIYRGCDYVDDLGEAHTFTNSVSKVSGFFFSSARWIGSAWHDYKVYKVSLNPADFVVETADTVTTNIPADSSFDVVLSHPISVTGNDENGRAEASINVLDSIVVSDGTRTLEQGTDYTVEFSDITDTSANTVKGVISIVPKTAWDYSTTYTVGLPTGLRNVARIAMPDTTADEATVAEVSFTTGKAPTFNMTLNAYKGLNDSTATEDLEGTVYLKATAVNDTGKAVDGGIIAIAVLDGDGNVVKYATTKKAFAIGGEASFGASFKLEAGQTAKAFVVGVNGEAVLD